MDNLTLAIYVAIILLLCYEIYIANDGTKDADSDITEMNLLPDPPRASGAPPPITGALMSAPPVFYPSQPIYSNLSYSNVFPSAVSAVYPSTSYIAAVQTGSSSLPIAQSTVQLPQSAVQTGTTSLPIAQPPLQPAQSGPRTLGTYKDITTDITAFNFSEAQARARHAFESDMTIIPSGAPVTRTSANIPGGTLIATDSAGYALAQPLIDDTIQYAMQTAGPMDERPDHRCGPLGDGAKCGTGRCCSIYGWCGNPGEINCRTSVNDSLYNGAGLPLPPGFFNGNVIRCAVDGAIYRLEDNRRRWYPNPTVYAKYGRPPYTNVDCNIIDSIVPGPVFT